MVGAKVYAALVAYLEQRRRRPRPPCPTPSSACQPLMADIDDDYEAEQTELYEFLAGLDDGAWRRPTPAAGWDVRDQVAHLAHTEEVAYDTATGGPRSLANETAEYTTGEEFTEAGCDQGRAMAPADVLEWWWSAAGRLRPALRDLDDDFRVPWGLGMKRRSFVTARLMEHWAHGLDIREAVGVDGRSTRRGCGTWRGSATARCRTRSAWPTSRARGPHPAPRPHRARTARRGHTGPTTPPTPSPVPPACGAAAPPSASHRPRHQRLVADGPLAELALAARPRRFSRRACRCESNEIRNLTPTRCFEQRCSPAEAVAGGAVVVEAAADGAPARPRPGSSRRCRRPWWCRRCRRWHGRRRWDRRGSCGRRSMFSAV